MTPLLHLNGRVSDNIGCHVLLTNSMVLGTQKRHEAHQKHRDPDDKEYSVSLTESGDMAKFLTAVKEGKDPLNCLDAPQPSGFAPSVIK